MWLFMETPQIRLTLSKSQSHIRHLARIIRDYHLFVNGWLMYNWTWEPENIRCIVVCRTANKPVGVGVIVKESFGSEPNMGIFVHPDYRGQGIGKQILEQIIKEPVHLKAAVGTFPSKKLYAKAEREGKLVVLY